MEVECKEDCIDRTILRERDSGVKMVRNAEDLKLNLMYWETPRQMVGWGPRSFDFGPRGCHWVTSLLMISSYLKF